MSTHAVLTLVVLIVALGLLASQRIRPALVALLVMLTLIVTGVLSPTEAFSAFGQPVIITIPGLFVLGAALSESGVATLIANRLMTFSRRGELVLTLVIMCTAGLLSAVLSSLLVVAVLMPAVLRLARDARIAPSRLLLPLVSAATMGNLLTLIGAISNLVISDLLIVSGYAPLGFLSLTPYGLVSLAAAIAWYLLAGRRLLRREVPDEPERPSLDQLQEIYRLGNVLYRLRVRAISALVGQQLAQANLARTDGLNVVAVTPQNGRTVFAGPDWELSPDDVLIVEGARADIQRAVESHQLDWLGESSLQEIHQSEHEALRLAELMVPFRSRLVGKSLAEVRFRERYGLSLLAAYRQGQAISRRLPELILAAGDTLLVQGPPARLNQVGRDSNLLLAADLGPQAGEIVTRKAKWAVVIMAMMLVTVVTGWMSLATAGLAAAVALVATGCIKPESAYRSVDVSLVVLVGCMLSLAMALEKTGVAETMAVFVATLRPLVGVPGTLLALYIFTVFTTQVISNTATIGLLTPLAINLAVVQGVAPEPFAIAIAVACTTSYLTPFTNAENLLVREAGRYSLRDYVLNGMPILVVQTAVVVAAVL
jgi:di/tricarboxylate transporter